MLTVTRFRKDYRGRDCVVLGFSGNPTDFGITRTELLLTEEEVDKAVNELIS